MHICFTLSSLSAGGAERVSVLLANQFIKCGHQVSLVLVSIDHNNSFYSIDNNVHVIPLLKTKKDKNPLRRVKILRKKLIEINPDIVIAFLPHICIYTHLALKKTKIPYICSERNDPKQYSFFRKILLKKSFSKANGCVFQTQDASNFYKKAKKHNSCIIYNPVSLSISPNIERKQQKDRVFISVGRLTPQKNFDLLITSFKDSSLNNKGYQLIIYGEGPLRNHLEFIIKKNNLSNCVFLPGNNPHWHDVAYNATAFISTSDYEGMPNCLEEALCLGCPCIATDCPVGGSKELIKLLKHGTLIQMNSKDQLVSKMIDVSKNGGLLLPDVNYDTLKIEFIAQQWVSFFERILTNVS